MANKLKNMHLTSVDLVRRGANQEADICLHKSADHQEAAGGPTEGEKNILKRFLAWLTENHSEARNEPHSPIEKNTPDADIYKDAITKSIQSIVADNSLSADEKDSMIAKSLGQYHDKMLELTQSKPQRVISKSDPDRFDHIEEIKKYNTNHDPKTGRFTSGSATGGIASRTITGGGISVHVKSGREPKDGYMCAVYGERSQWLKGDDVTDPVKREASIKSFMEKNADVLSDPDNYLGTWFDTSTGNISLDISRNFSDKAKAIKFASEHNEKAIWDVANMTEINTGGTGNNL